MRKSRMQIESLDEPKAAKDREEVGLASLGCKSDSTLQLPVDPHQGQRYKP